MDDVPIKLRKKKKKHKYYMILLTCNSETGKENYFIELEVKIVCIFGEDKGGVIGKGFTKLQLVIF